MDIEIQMENPCGYILLGYVYADEYLNMCPTIYFLMVDANSMEWGVIYQCCLQFVYEWKVEKCNWKPMILHNDCH